MFIVTAISTACKTCSVVIPAKMKLPLSSASGLSVEVRFLKYRLNNHKRYIGHFFRYLEWGPPEEMPDGRYKLTQEQFHILMNEHPSKPTQLKPKKSSSKSKPQHKVVLY
jgi:hypothetical protein